MFDIKQLENKSIEILNQEIEERQILLKELTGVLYRKILEDEIIEIYQLIRKKREQQTGM